MSFYADVFLRIILLDTFSLPLVMSPIWLQEHSSGLHDALQEPSYTTCDRLSIRCTSVVGNRE
jgi:hypothetical protein